jgi:hypothetical protein
MAVELRTHNICDVSLWPGAVKTEHTAETMKNELDFPQRVADASRGSGPINLTAVCLI